MKVERKMNKRKFGLIGEKIAQKYLKSKNYKILKTNYYTKIGEIDIIAEKEKYIVFIEVKTRTSFKYGTPAMSVNKTKIMHMRSAAKIFIHCNKLYKYNIRFDVIEIIIKNGKCKINHIKAIV